MNNKTDLITTYKINEKDTGSSSVQIAILTERINGLVEHLKEHKKDHACRRGLLMMVHRRKRLMRYLSKKSPTRYQLLVSSLKIKG